MSRKCVVTWIDEGKVRIKGISILRFDKLIKLFYFPFCVMVKLFNAFRPVVQRLSDVMTNVLSIDP